MIILINIYYIYIKYLLDIIINYYFIYFKKYLLILKIQKWKLKYYKCMNYYLNNLMLYLMIISINVMRI